MSSTRIPRPARGLAGGASAAFLLILTHVSLAHGAGAQEVRAGRYEFRAVAAGDRPFEGTIHLTRADGVVGGRVLSTLGGQIPITGAALRGDTVEILGRFGGSRVLTIRLAPKGDSLVGTFNDGRATGPMRARYATAAGEDPNELRPTPCGVPGLDEMVRCATHWVWEDRARRAGRRIPISIVVLPATGPSRTGDPLFHFAGGPGQSSTSQAGGNAERFAEIRRSRDIVMVDQRGTGGSNELACTFAGARERAELLLGGLFPAEQLAACRASVESRADPRLYHTAAAVEDVEEVRAWLGYERINLYGGSYGTRAALAYMRAHPDRVRTATLRAVQSPGSSILDGPADAQAALDRVIEACAAEAACAAAYPRLRAQLAEVLAALERAPVPLRVFDAVRRDTVEVPLTRPAFAGSLRRLLMDGESVLRVPLAIDQASRGDWSLMRSGLARTVGVAGDLAWGMMISVVCAEDPPLVRRGDVARATANTFTGDAQVRAVLRGCEAWPAGAPPSSYDDPVRADVPTLLISGEFDPTTPPRMGEAVAKALPRSVHVVLPGVSHGPFPACAVGVMRALVESGRVEGLDASCVAGMRRGRFVVGR